MDVHKIMKSSRKAEDDANRKFGELQKNIQNHTLGT